MDRRQAALAVVVTLTVIGIFLGTDWPRAVVALVGGCVLLVVGVPRSRSLRMMHRLRRWPMARVLFHGFPRQAGGYVYAIRAARGVTHSVKMLALVDWPLLILFIGLFVVNGAMRQTGMVAQTLATASSGGWNLTHPANLFISTAVLSNLVSNVPAVMLLLPTATHHAANPSLNGAVLALASTLAGNLLIVGSIANIIVVGQAKALGVHISWWRHAKIGIPVTLATLAVAAGWLWLWWRFL